MLIFTKWVIYSGQIIGILYNSLIPMLPDDIILSLSFIFLVKTWSCV